MSATSFSFRGWNRAFSPRATFALLIGVFVTGSNALGGNITGRFATITVDGRLDEWMPTDVMYPAAEIGAGQPPASTYSSISVCNDGAKLYVGLQLKDASSIKSTWTHNLFIDSDLNPNTGYRGSKSWMAGGYDRLVQYGAGGAVYAVYEFAGAEPGEWKWKPVGDLTYSYKGEVIEWAIPLPLLGLTGKKMRLEFSVSGGEVTVETWAHLSEASAGVYTLADR